MVLYYISLLMLPMGDATTLFFLNPPITAVAAWAIRSAPPMLERWLAGSPTPAGVPTFGQRWGSDKRIAWGA